MKTINLVPKSDGFVDSMFGITIKDITQIVICLAAGWAAKSIGTIMGLEPFIGFICGIMAGYIATEVFFR